MSKITDLYTACSIVEGFSGEEHTARETLEAWAYLVATGHCWKLQGWYGRNASHLIESGIITKSGKITPLAKRMLAEHNE